MKISNLHIFFIGCIALFTLSISCEKRVDQPVPSVYIDFTINIRTDPAFFDLLAQGNSLIIKNGDVGELVLGYDNNGVVLYNGGNNDFYAFDLTCPYDIPASVALVADGNNVTVKCPQCKTVYVLSSDGMPTFSGPGILPLREYSAVYNSNTGSVRVFNK